MQYRFPKWKDASWNSYDRQKARYEAICDFLDRDQVGAEIGVYKGGFGEFLLAHCTKLYLVDPWYRVKGFWSTDIELDSRAQTVIDILTVYKNEIDKGQVEVIIDYSVNFFNSVPDDHFDFIYLDSSHKYEQTVTELFAARRVVKNGGIICGDDYTDDPNSKHYGVFQAISEAVQDRWLMLETVRSRQWIARVIKF